MLRSLTAKQFMEWQAFAALEPFGEARADWRAASIAQMVFNMAVRPNDRRPLKDFVLRFGEEGESRPAKAGRSTQTPEQQNKILYMWAKAMAADSKKN